LVIVFVARIGQRAEDQSGFVRVAFLKQCKVINCSLGLWDMQPATVSSSHRSSRV
jgi:hypothetical protein